GRPLTAEYLPPAPAGVRVACVSGQGADVGVLRNLNPGVLTVSLAVLLDARWQAADADAAWAAAAARRQVWKGWENCGVKPEGAPYPSSAVMPAADGGYAEDLYAGNPSTNFTTIRLPVLAADAAAMRGPGGFATRDDPARPLILSWRAFADADGHTIWIERGEPAPGAPAGTQGFITLFLPDT
ncbi:hypothetical protein, partial [Pelomonas sp. KK5]|uniref:hypothetical protein n=1 Tax=Pelomonas sp. KK5 TaxID=1855730 RepID=UPI00097C3766